MHNIYPYIGKFNKIIPQRVIDDYWNEGMVVLDPFCGSGTTLHECSLRGIEAYGVDINPIAILVSKVKVTNYDKSIASQHLEKILCGSEKADEYDWMGEWFNDENKDALLKLWGSILMINDSYKDLFKVIFLSMLTKVCNRRKTWNIGYISDNVKPNIDVKVDVVNLFKKKFNALTFNSIEVQNYGNIIESDFRETNLKNSYFDLVITSPPYPFAVDFVKNNRLQLKWLNKDVDLISSKETGARTKRNRNSEVPIFFEEIKELYVEIYNKVKSGGIISMTIGDTTRKKEKINFVSMIRNLLVNELNCSILLDEIRELKNQSTANKKINHETLLIVKKS